MGLPVIIPAKDEASSISIVISQIFELFPDAEVLVIDDGSVDSTAARARDAKATVISHPRSLGNGAAIKTGARHATGDVLVMLDADGQHDPADIPRLLEQLDAGHHMVIGARSSGSHANVGRLFANGSYNVIDRTGRPQFPEGYAELNRRPMYSQQAAELMAGLIPATPDHANQPHGLGQVVIGEHTAREINWLDH